jgi:hypothetical protein
MSPLVAELARKLEFMGKEQSNGGIIETFEELRSVTRLLANDLKDIRTEYI